MINNSMQQFHMDVKEPIVDKQTVQPFQTDVQGKWMWPIRIGSFILFVATVIVNYIIGMETGRVSDEFHLFITPPGMFFTIWAVIYTALAVVNVYNLIKNTWTKKVHMWFSLSNILNSIWIIIFNIGTPAAVYVCSAILIALVPAILLTWFALGQRPVQSYDSWTYITRNVFAFYLGWVIAAANLNLGMDIVYWWGASKETQLAIFWVMAPLCAVGATAFNFIKEGKQGILSCFVLWFSVAWAFTGAAITSHGCLSKTLTLC